MSQIRRDWSCVDLQLFVLSLLARFLCYPPLLRTKSMSLDRPKYIGVSVENPLGSAAENPLAAPVTDSLKSRSCQLH